MAGKDARVWVMKALGYAAVAYGAFDILTGKPEERLAVLIFIGLLSVGLIILFTIMHAKGYWWKKPDTKTSPLAKDSDEGV
jgi:hypothetical protein